ncbi:Thiosulfate sulfurtransferase YnjE precursor [Leclercia adecarboxylata]|uniref:Thiosulfate sulfurtransferase YnjE n=1 Tax=Leclercia adecarboxylata TaxID=83655 RepID=A0A4U9HRV8_9ENTR|nr:Thiosulfate sulfurtransferase YnjE precursor [Leclercia adecarboxylata]
MKWKASRCGTKFLMRISKRCLAKHGIRHDTTVILYGRDVYAAARVAQIMLYAGVKDVRLLDGGWKAWDSAKLPVQRGTPNKVTPAADFGAPIPGQPQLMLNTEQARGLLHRKDASLVSIRSWPEFTGVTSGYSYIKPKGEIAGARWGHAGSDSTHMEDFHNPDGTMRSAEDIAAMWKQWHILPGSAGGVLLRHRLAGIGNLYVCPGDGLEKCRRL